jgi:phosphoribosylformylglycinamidine synthase subunit PurQ / glutaminase
MTIGVVVFPGSNCDRDVRWALEGCLGYPTRFLWHEERDLSGLDAVVIPGGFSYGDYLRCGAIARFAPRAGGGEGLCRSGWAGAGHLQRFPSAHGDGPAARCPHPQRQAPLHLRTDSHWWYSPASCRWLQTTADGETIQLPIAHGEGRYQCDQRASSQAWRAMARWCFRYAANPNGSIGDVAGLTNAAGNVLGLMPHPERACDPATGGIDGRRLMASLLG